MTLQAVIRAYTCVWEIVSVQGPFRPLEQTEWMPRRDNALEIVSQTLAFTKLIFQEKQPETWDLL